MKRRFLLLQSVCSPFFGRLGDALVAAGHSVCKVNFSGGDLAYWGLRKSRLFRGDQAELADFHARLQIEEGVTDQILFGDRRPVHRPAIMCAEANGVRTHVFEEGYFRPHWVTLEREGVNGHSLLPRDPDWFWAAGADLPDASATTPFRSNFLYRAWHDVLYRYANTLNPLLFHRYPTHYEVPALVEHLGYLSRQAQLKLGREARDSAVIRELSGPFYVLPLQLSSDAQIRDHSSFSGMPEVIDAVLASFARHAPAAARLVIKNHPLDIGISRFPEVIEAAARRWEVQGRVVYLESGGLEKLVSKAAGLLTVNSTAGCVGLQLGCPVVTLGDPIYNLPGLTFQGGLDQFWRAGEPANAEMFRRFRNVVMHATQVNGGFYCARGIALAVRNACQVLTAEVSPLEALLSRVQGGR